ncbi:hypothetical protein Zmor_002253 [Zophobas morio]|uniref:Uncharacterized protein n=1 Tax=Zophobas morio TaxID=2755281 RepID=A0AA38J088_9CUCU|nr:hypothetical protein Zmor_002253 [Zophobas morio]
MGEEEKQNYNGWKYKREQIERINPSEVAKNKGERSETEERKEGEGIQDEKDRKGKMMAKKAEEEIVKSRNIVENARREQRQIYG